MGAGWRGCEWRSPLLQAEGKGAGRFPEYSAVPFGVPQFLGHRRGKLWLWKGHVVSKGTSHHFPAWREGEPGLETLRKHRLHPWLLVLLPAAGCGEGVMGQGTGLHWAGVDVLGKSFDC